MKFGPFYFGIASENFQQLAGKSPDKIIHLYVWYRTDAVTRIVYFVRLEQGNPLQIELSALLQLKLK